MNNNNNNMNPLERFKQRQLSLSKSLNDTLQKREEALQKKRQQYEHQPPPPPPSSNANIAANRTQKIDPRNLPMVYRIKQVLDFLTLCSRNGRVTSAMIRDGCGRDLDKEKDLQKTLVCNEKVEYDPDTKTYMYKRDTSIQNKEQLLRHIEISERPVTLSELADAYPDVWADLRVLQAERLVYRVLDVYFANDMSVVLPVDTDIQKLWMSLSVPTDDTSMAAALRMAHMEPTPKQLSSYQSSLTRKKKKKKTFM